MPPVSPRLTAMCCAKGASLVFSRLCNLRNLWIPHLLTAHGSLLTAHSSHHPSLITHHCTQQHQPGNIKPQREEGNITGGGSKHWCIKRAERNSLRQRSGQPLEPTSVRRIK